MDPPLPPRAIAFMHGTEVCMLLAAPRVYASSRDRMPSSTFEHARRCLDDYIAAFSLAPDDAAVRESVAAAVELREALVTWTSLDEVPARVIDLARRCLAPLGMVPKVGWDAWDGSDEPPEPAGGETSP